MFVNDCEVLKLVIEDEDIAEMLNDHQREIVKKSLQLSAADKRVQVAEKLTIAENKENALKSQKMINKMNLQREEALRTLEIQTEVNRKKEAEEQAAKQAEKDLQVVYDAIADAKRNRQAKDNDQELANKEALLELEKAKQKAYADTVVSIMNAVSPDLVAALTSNANSDMVSALEHAVAPYAIAQGEESVADVVARLTKGLPIEEAINKLAKVKN